MSLKRMLLILVKGIDLQVACPVIVIDGTLSVADNVEKIMNKLGLAVERD